MDVGNHDSFLDFLFLEITKIQLLPPQVALKGMGGESDGVHKGQHPYFLALVFVPHQEFLYVLGNQYVDGIIEGDGFVHSADGGIDGHTVVG